jgi:hypothetical protein
MKKRWFIIPAVLLLAPFGIMAALPTVLPIVDAYRPRPNVPVTDGMRAQAIEALAANLDAHYVFPDKGRALAALLRTRQQQGAYGGVVDGERLARQLTDDLSGVAHDVHMRVVFDTDVVPVKLGPPPDPRTQPRGSEGNAVMGWIDSIGRRMATFGVDKIQRRDGNVGYLKMSGFAPPWLAGEKYAAAIDELADTRALIIDLRGSNGGHPKAVALLISYMVDDRTRLNDLWARDTGATTQHWTEAVAGKRFGGKKPIMILVDTSTKSAAEDFAYTMQAMRRATIVGARTWGGAHPTGLYRLGDHFVGMIPNQRSINPITHSNWEGTGVIPDLPVASADALATAEQYLARSAVTRVATN